MTADPPGPDVPAAPTARPAWLARRRADLRARLSPRLPVVAAWGLSRAGTYLAAWVATYLFVGARLTPFPASWLRWDAAQFAAIARSGYGGGAVSASSNDVAFLPGLPLLLRAVHAVLPSWTLSGLAISAVALLVALLALDALGELDAPGSGRRAGLALLLAPSAVFLAAGYSEALFLAFAVPAWLAARRGRWLLAGLLVAGAGTVRATGLFLLAGLVVLLLTQTPGLAGRDRARGLAALSLGLVPPAGYELWLRAATGDWTAWLDAQRRGWYRQLSSPLASWQQTWWAAFGGGQRPEVAVIFSLELVAGLLGLAGLVVLLATRRWGEAAYLAASLAAYQTSTWWISIARSSLLWFPLWLLLGRAATRHRWVLAGYAALSAPVGVLVLAAFVTGRWAG